jgi:hypothetical protein
VFEVIVEMHCGQISRIFFIYIYFLFFLAGADISQLINSSAIKSVVKGKGAITMDLIDEARDDILMGIYTPPPLFSPSSFPIHLLLPSSLFLLPPSSSFLPLPPFSLVSNFTL